MKKLMYALVILAFFSLCKTTILYAITNGETINIVSNEPLHDKKQSLDKEPEQAQSQKTKENVHIENNLLKEHSNAMPEAQIKSIEDKIKDKEPSDISQETNSIQTTTESIHGDITLSNEEIDLLARIVRAEAQVEPFQGKVAVAWVVLNRVKHPQFPDTVKEVIYQSNQFQPVLNGEINKPADQDSYDAVQTALSDHHHIAEDSLFFYNPEIATSRWLDSRETTVEIGQHVFKK